MGNTERRVVITGLGVIAPNGRNKDEFWDSCLNGISGIKKIKSFDANQFSTQIAGEVSNFDPEFYDIDKKQSRRMGRFSRYALAASKMAVADSLLKLTDEEKHTTCIVLGVSVNGVEIIEREVNVLRDRGAEKMNPFGVSGALPSAASGHVAVELGIKGRNMTISTGCSSSLNAIGHAYELIRYNKIDRAICGGAESPITPSVLGAFCASGVLSKRNDEPEKASRPFDKNRDGYVLSEGAAVFILESEESARRRKTS